MRGDLNLEYVRPDGLAACLEKHEGYVLGVVGFGARIPPQSSHPAALWVQVPVLNGDAASFEVWTTSSPATPCGQGNITAFTDGDVLFGSMQLEQPAGVSFEALCRQAYLDLFAFTDRAACRNLLRVWNYLPRINEPEGGLERYRCFNAGRHSAFTLSGRDINAETVPAASVLGCEPGPMVIYFLAAARPGRTIDNPRQVASYRYPAQYGPRSPIFARAMLAQFGPRRGLILSGTASIVGHETVHKGDAEQQTAETIRNIRTLVQQAYPDAPDIAENGQTRLKVYVRNAHDMERAQEHIERAFVSGEQAIYLQSNICRSDLLVEIEGIHFREDPA